MDLIQSAQLCGLFCWEFIKLFLLGVYVLLEKLLRVFISRPLKSLEGEIILITGTGNGIGKQLAHELSSVGADTLILWDIETSANEKTANELRNKKLKTKILSYTVDISNRDEVAYAAQKVRIEAGDVTVLINNAGIAPIGYFLDSKVDILTKVFDVNVFAHFWTLQEFLPKMIENNHGHVITTASIASFLPSRELATYSATKHAIHGFIEAIKQEIRQSSPGPTDQVFFTTAYPTFVQTRLMNGITLTPRYKILFQVMSPEYIASKIVEGFRQNYEHLFLPPSITIMSYIGTFMPAEIHKLLQDGLFACKVEYSVTNGFGNGVGNGLGIEKNEILNNKYD